LEHYHLIAARDRVYVAAHSIDAITRTILVSDVRLRADVRWNTEPP
jgi:hypothetical protein